MEKNEVAGVSILSYVRSRNNTDANETCFNGLHIMCVLPGVASKRIARHAYEFVCREDAPEHSRELGSIAFELNSWSLHCVFFCSFQTRFKVCTRARPPPEMLPNTLESWELLSLSLILFVAMRYNGYCNVWFVASKRVARYA